MTASVALYCINLQDAGARRALMEEQFAQISFPAQFIEAVDGRALDIASVKEYDRKARLRYGADLAPNEIACALSHKRALETFLASGNAFGVVLEDDVKLAGDFETAIRDLLGREAKWDVVRFHLARKNKRPLKVRKLNDRYDLIVPFNATHGLLGSIYTKQGAAKAAKSLERFHLAADTHLGETFRNSLVTAALSPPLVFERDIVSTIGARPKGGDMHEGSALKKLRLRRMKLERSIGKRVDAARTWLRLRGG